MAASGDSHAKFEGKIWSFLADSVDFPSLSSEQNNDDSDKSGHHTSTSFLRKDEMSTYGYCPVWEDFYLVVCDVCGLSVKPQALRHHIDVRHGGVHPSTSSKWILSSSTSSSNLTTTAVHISTLCSSGTSRSVGDGEEPNSHSITTTTSVATHASLAAKRSRDKLLRRSPNSRLSSSTNSDTLQRTAHPTHPSHVPPACNELTSLCMSSPDMSMLHPTTSTHHTLNATAISSNNVFSEMAAVLDPQPESSIASMAYHHRGVGSHSVHHNPAASVSLAPDTIPTPTSTNNIMPYSSDTSIRISLPAISSSASSRNTSRCSSSNSVSHSGSNSTVSNNLELGISNGCTDYNDSGSGILDGSDHTRIATMSPVLDFPSPSPGSFSKDDEDSLDSRLRALHSPNNATHSVLTQSSQLLHHPQQQHQQHHHLSNFAGDGASHATTLMNPSPQYGGSQANTGPHSVGSHCMGGLHCIEPLSVGPASVGPPSVGPPSVGIPSLGAPGSAGSANIASSTANNNSNRNNLLSSISPTGVLLPSNNLLMNGNSPHPTNSSLLPTNSMPRANSAEEEVNRISAMLQKEVEALTASQNLDMNSHVPSNSLSTHDVVEAQGLAARGQLSNALCIPSNLPEISSQTNSSNNSISLCNSSLNHSNPMNINNISTLNHSNNLSSTRQLQDHSNNSNHNNMGSVPVPIVHVPLETLNQIQADLLATVSESDLNAVLNATPDSSDPTGLPNNSQGFFSDNSSVQFADSALINSSGSSHLRQDSITNSNSSRLSQHHFGRDSSSALGAVEQGTRSSTHNRLLQYNRTNMISQNNDAMHMSPLHKMLTHSEELTNAVNSITQGSNNNVGNSFESQLSGYLQHHHVSQNAHLSQVVSSPALSPSPSISVGTLGLTSVSPLSVSSVSSLPMVSCSNVQDMATLGQSVVTSQGITVVIGGTGTPITLPQSPISSVASTSIRKPTTGSILSNQRLLSQSPNMNVTRSPLHTSFNSGGHTPLHNLATTGVAVTQVTPPHSTPSPKKSTKKKKKGAEPRKVVPLKDREYNPEKHCGVLVAETGKPCTRSLTCKTHSLTMRRAVNSRSKKFDDLLLEHKANKPPKSGESSLTAIQGTPSRGVATTPTTTTTTNISCCITTNINTAGSSSSMPITVGSCAVSGYGGTSADVCTSPLLARSLGGVVPPSTPSPLSHHHQQQLHPMDPPCTPQHTPASPYHWTGSVPSSGAALTRPTLAHTDHFYVATSPQPVATCTYNSRRLGGFLATDHKADLLRSVLRTALKKPACLASSSAVSCLLDQTCNVVAGAAVTPGHLSAAAVAERLNNVKPLLARKLQATVPIQTGTLTSKDGITVGTGYNGHIQVATSNLGIVASVANNAQIKRSLHHIDTINKATTITLPKNNIINTNNSCNNANKNKKAKLSENGPGVNILGNIVQVEAASSSGSKSHGLPLVAVSLPNGLTGTQQPITLSNVNMSGMRTAAGTQPIRIHPSAVKTLLRDSSDSRTVGGVVTQQGVGAALGGQTINTDGSTNIVLNSGTASYLIADGLKSFKTDSSGGIRLELHGSTFADSRFIHATPINKVVTSGALAAPSTGVVGGSVNAQQQQHLQQQPQQHYQQQPQQQVQQHHIQQQPQVQQQQQVTYLEPAVATITSQHLTLQQVLHRLQSKGGGGLKLYTPPGGGTSTGVGVARAGAATPHHRTTYVLHQDNQPS